MALRRHQLIPFRIFSYFGLKNLPISERDDMDDALVEMIVRMTSQIGEPFPPETMLVFTPNSTWSD